MKLENFIVVLVAPRRQGNVGSAARAMKNCGLTQLRLVGGRQFGKITKRFAVHAEDLLRSAQRFRKFDPAIAEATRIVGFSSKRYAVGPKPRSLPEIASELRAASDAGPVALVFGREDHGLLKDEIRRCTDLVRIPANPGYPVLNLAQSVLLAGYEIALAPASLRRSGAKTVPSRLPRQHRQSLIAQFERLLISLSYGRPVGRNLSARILQRLSVQFDRALGEEADLQLWMGLLKRLKQKLPQG